jgi:hypothetical protein
MSLSKRARADELAKVTSLKARIPYMSQSALGALLHIAKQEHLPQVSTRKAIREARNKHVTMATPYGPVHQRIDLGGGVSAEVQHPMAMLYAVSASSPAFAVLLRRALSRFPCSPVSPWKLILYTDEVSPGNQLAYAHERKTWAWYWSFMEFEQSLSSEDVRTHTHIYNSPNKACFEGFLLVFYRIRYVFHDFPSSA